MLSTSFINVDINDPISPPFSSTLSLPLAECGYYLSLETFECFDPHKCFTSADHGWAHLNPARLESFWHPQQKVFKEHSDRAVRENRSRMQVRHEGALLQCFISEKITRAVFKLAYFSLQRNLLLQFVFEMLLTAFHSSVREVKSQSSHPFVSEIASLTKVLSEVLLTPLNKLHSDFISLWVLQSAVLLFET